MLVIIKTNEEQTDYIFLFEVIWLAILLLISW